MVFKLCVKVFFIIKLTTPVVLNFLKCDFLCHKIYSIFIRKDEFFSIVYLKKLSLSFE